MAKKSAEKTGATKKVAASKGAKVATIKSPAKKSPVKKPKAAATPTGAAAPKSSTSHPLRNSDFPQTYIKEITVSLDDPDHWVTLKWTGPDASEQETGPFRSAPGAGKTGLNCNLTATSQRSGSLCTPKGTHVVEGFSRRLNSDSRAEYVTWFVQRRGIAFHYFPYVPKHPASHGCVRLATKRTARLIQDNSRIDRTKVTIGGTWTKPQNQW